MLFIGQLADNRTIIAIAGAIALISFGAIGWRLLTESDEQGTGGSAPHCPLAQGRITVFVGWLAPIQLLPDAGSMRRSPQLLVRH